MDDKELIKSAPKRWNHKANVWEYDAGFVAAKRAGTSTKRSRKLKTGAWTEGYKESWTKWDKPKPKWAQKSAGDVDSRVFIRIWNDCSDLEQLHKKLFWFDEKTLVKRMRTLKKWLNGNGLSSPPVLKDPTRLMDDGDVRALLHSGVIKPLDANNNPKQGEYKKLDNGKWKFHPDEK